MTTKRGGTSGSKRTTFTEPSSLPDDFPSELLGEFSDLPRQFWDNFGTVSGLALAKGGYIGLSVTDDGGSAKLAVRCSYVSFEKRVYKLADLERLTAYLLGKVKS